MITFAASDVPALKSAMELLRELIAAMKDPKEMEKYLQEMQSYIATIDRLQAEAGDAAKKLSEHHTAVKKTLDERETALLQREAAMASSKELAAEVERRRLAVEEREKAVAEREKSASRARASLDNIIEEIKTHNAVQQGNIVKLAERIG